MGEEGLLPNSLASESVFLITITLWQPEEIYLAENVLLY